MTNPISPVNTDKKNQHYLPKFYLRNFSFQNNKKQIGIYNTKTCFFISNGKLKKQGAQNFFYGQDGVIEDSLSKIEDSLAPLIRDIISTKELPAKNSFGHMELLSFLVMTHLRNPVPINNIVSGRLDIQNRIQELYPNHQAEKVVPEAENSEAIQLALSGIKTSIMYARDLDYKIIINDTNTPFISSDFPVVKYNQFLEELKWPNGKTGYGNSGLQIFLPLSPEICLMFYDSQVYKVGNKKDSHLTVKNAKDIDQINLLQHLNCSEVLFFNEKINEHYLYILNSQAKKYAKANTTKTKVYPIANSPTSKALIGLGTTDCEIKLNIEGIKKSSRALGVELTRSMAQLRPHALRVRIEREKEFQRHDRQHL